MIDHSVLKQQWEQGFCVFPQFLNQERVERLREICDRILEQWLDRLPAASRNAPSTNMAYLTEPHYFQTNTEELLELLEFVADPEILRILTSIAGEKPLFNNTQYFFNNPLSPSWEGDWHRDTQFLAPEPELEQQRMQQFTGVHFRVALLPDSCFAYVPASEQRWDSSEEYAIRKGEGKPKNDRTMPNQQTIHLNLGDGLLFHAWGIHRGIYQQQIPRRTLDVIYQWGGICDYFPPPPTCFQEQAVLDRLSPGAKEFFDYFVQTYESFW